MTKPPLLLIADDYDHAAALIAELVALDTRYEAVSAKDGQEAVEQALGRRPDACLFDVDMPRLDGITAARAMHAAFGEGRPLMIAMTGGGNINDAVRSGWFDAVLPKPIDMPALYRLLEGARRLP